MNRKILKSVFLILTLKCDESSRLMSQKQETQLNRAERWALGLHLLICKSCRKYKNQLKMLRAIFNKISQPSTYTAEAPSLLDAEQTRSLQKRISKRIQENLDSM